jgi:hypothetical protein
MGEQQGDSRRSLNTGGLVSVLLTSSVMQGFITDVFCQMSHTKRTRKEDKTSNVFRLSKPASGFYQPKHTAYFYLVLYVAYD